MRMLLVYANTHRFMAPIPVGLSLVARAARDAGHDVHMLDLMWARDPDGALAEALEEVKPELVGLSLRNIDDQDYADPTSFVPDYCRWVGMAMEVAPTVVGGSALASMPEALFERLGATYAVIGQANRTFPDFVRELEAGAATFETPGVMWRRGDEIVSNPPLFDGYREAGSIPWDLVEWRRYRRGMMPVCVITKSGCPYQCTFCDAPASFGAEFVAREPEAIVEDLQRDAAEHRHHRFQYFFVDAAFNEPLPWAKSVLEAIVRSGLRIGFCALVEPTPRVDRELVRLLRRAGCEIVTGLIGSADDEILHRMRRPFSAEHIASAYQLFEEEGLPYIPQLLFGSPGETDETVERSFRFLEARKPFVVEYAVGVRVYPSAGIYEQAVEEGRFDDDVDMIAPQFYMSDAVDVDALRARVGRAQKRMPPLGQLAAYCARAARRRLRP